jgi:hypothetical protein
MEDEERAKENFLAAAELGHARAMLLFGGLLGKVDPQRFFWLERAAANGYPFVLLNEMSDHVRNFSSGSGNAVVIFVIGRALKGRISNEKRTIFGKSYKFDTCIGSANQALHFYDFQSVLKAVDMWTAIALRNTVVKDIRKMIGKMIWDARRSSIFGRETIGQGYSRRKESSVEEEMVDALKDAHKVLLCLSNYLKLQLSTLKRDSSSKDSIFLLIMSGSVFLHRQLSAEDLQQLRAWYKIREKTFSHRTSRKRSSSLLFVRTQMLSG